MSLLDKQDIQDICGHTALHAKNGSDLYVNEHHKIQHYCARSTKERIIRRKKKNAKRYFLLRTVHM